MAAASSSNGSRRARSESGFATTLSSPGADASIGRSVTALDLTARRAIVICRPMSPRAASPTRVSTATATGVSPTRAPSGTASIRTVRTSPTLASDGHPNVAPLQEPSGRCTHTWH